MLIPCLQHQNKHIPPSNIIYLIELLKSNFWVACQPTITQMKERNLMKNKSSSGPQMCTSLIQIYPGYIHIYGDVYGRSVTSHHLAAKESTIVFNRPEIKENFIFLHLENILWLRAHTWRSQSCEMCQTATQADVCKLHDSQNENSYLMQELFLIDERHW